MTLFQKLLKIDSILHDNGGINAIYIRAALENVEQEMIRDNNKAIQFAKELDDVLRFCELVVNRSTETRS